MKLAIIILALGVAIGWAWMLRHIRRGGQARTAGEMSTCDGSPVTPGQAQAKQPHLDAMPDGGGFDGGGGGGD